MASFLDKDLLPCPFCGGSAEWEYTPFDDDARTGDDGSGWVECQKCHAQVTGYDRADGEQRWNARTGGPTDGDVNAALCSPDKLMEINQKLAACVSFLIEACKHSEGGRRALAQWDKYRGYDVDGDD